MRFARTARCRDWGDCMSKLLDRCKKCVDQVYIDWNKAIISNSEKRQIEEYEAWGIVHLALYILNFDEYNEFKRYIYEKYGYDPGGVSDGQISMDEIGVI